MTTPTRPPAPADSATPLALGAYVKLSRAAEAVAAALRPDLEAAGLTEAQFGVLEALHHAGPMHQCDLARKTLRSTGNMTLVIDNLERRGLVQRQRSAADRRYVAVHLTGAGDALIGALFPAHAARIRALFAVLTPQEQQLLGHLTRRLGLAAAAGHANRTDG